MGREEYVLELPITGEVVRVAQGHAEQNRAKRIVKASTSGFITVQISNGYFRFFFFFPRSC